MQGYKTKSFWFALAATVAAALTASGAIGDGGIAGQAIAAGGSALAAAGYASMRAFAKGANGKPAWKTTEFWMTCAAVAVGALLASGVFPADGTAAKLVGGAAALLAALGYGARGALPPKA